MAEKRSKLQLVLKDSRRARAHSAHSEFEEVRAPAPEPKASAAAEETSRSLVITNITELSAGEGTRVERIVHETAPGATIQGVIRTERAWDLRPLIKEGALTSLIRLFGPEVTLSLEETSRATNLLQKLSQLEDSGTTILALGSLDGQIYYRRPLYLSSLSERLESAERFSFRWALGVALEVVRILRFWHRHGLVHGHLSSGNICFSGRGEIALTDAGIRACQMRAAREIGINRPESLGDERFFAPEVLSRGEFSPESDIYALGFVFQDLFRKVRRTPQSEAGVGSPGPDLDLNWMNQADRDAIRELTSGMCEERREGRAPLEYVERVLESRSIREAEPAAPPSRALIQSSIVQPVQKVVAVVPALAHDLAPQPPAPLIEIQPEQQEAYFLPSGADALLPVEPIFTDTEQAGYEWTGEREASQPGESDDRSYPEQNALQDPVDQRSANFFRYAVIVLSILCAFLFYRAFFNGPSNDFEEMNDSDISSAWDSSVPSEMSLVAAASIGEPAPQQKHAERIILRSAFSGDKVSDLVNYPLIRLAFDVRWEKSLSPMDRRVALTIALGRLLGEKYLPKEKVDLAKLHPGVLFAVLSTLGNVPGVGEIPASKLTSLPPPFNFAFQELVTANPKITCGDPAIWGLARFWSKASLSVDDVLPYLQGDTEPKLRALGILSAANPVRARQLLELLLNHPNLRLDHEIIRWGIKVKLTSWADMQPADQLFVLVGIPPTTQLSSIQYVELLAHPSPRMRQIAINGVINQIPLAHPAAVPVLNALKEKPEQLNGRQTIELTQFLEKPSSATREAVQSWCSSAPNTFIMAELLASTADQPQSTPFDANLSLCLQHADWTPSVDQLRKLSHHPDSLTRVFVYMKLVELGAKDPNTALEIFTGALKREPREDLRRQIELNINSLKLG